jgi:alpha-D-ribose 1-methylphosphonate 5-triphosphate diphosphatase
MSVSETRIFSRSLVTPGGRISGQVVVRDGLIAAVEPAAGPGPGAADWGEDVLIPGLVDIHTDNFEKHYQPRPGALWDAYGAALAHDGQCASAGITTVFDSLSLHGAKDGLDRREALAPMIEAMDAATADGALRADHLLHLRCEVTNPELIDLLGAHLDHPRLKLLSVMDHTPGQRQMADVAQFEQQLLASGYSPAEIEALLARQYSGGDRSIPMANRAKVVEISRAMALPLAAHDDENRGHVEEAHRDGCVISEFPVSREAARAARALGMAVAMGGPNFVRGGSHSGNLSARDCAQADMLDIIASDYVPLSMLRAAFMLIDDMGWAPEKAVATVSGNPARAVGLSDRGEIAPGLRADLVRVRRGANGWPVPAEVWRRGARVA